MRCVTLFTMTTTVFCWGQRPRKTLSATRLMLCRGAGWWPSGKPSPSLLRGPPASELGRWGLGLQRPWNRWRFKFTNQGLLYLKVEISSQLFIILFIYLLILFIYLFYLFILKNNNKKTDFFEKKTLVFFAKKKHDPKKKHKCLKFLFYSVIVFSFFLIINIKILYSKICEALVLSEAWAFIVCFMTSYNKLLPFINSLPCI